MTEDIFGDVVISAQEEQDKHEREMLYGEAEVAIAQQPLGMEKQIMSSMGIEDNEVTSVVEPRPVPSRWKQAHKEVNDYVQIAAKYAQQGLANATLAIPIMAETTFNAAIDGLKINDMAARMGRGVGFDVDSDFFQLHLFDHIYDTIQKGSEAAYPGAIPENVDTIPKMVIAGAAQMVPEAVGAAVSGQTAIKLSTAMFGKLNRLATPIAHWAGVTFYGGSSGYAESGELEGGLHGAQSWGTLDACLAPFRGKSKILQSVVGGTILSGYTALMADEDEDPNEVQKQVIAAGILGTIFPWMSRKKGAKLSNDFKGLIEPIQNWMAKDAKLKIKVEPGSYINNFYDVLVRHYERSAVVPMTKESLTKHFQELVSDRTGRPITAEGKELQVEISKVLQKGPGGNNMSPAKFDILAKRLVDAAKTFDAVQSKQLYDGLEGIKLDPAKEPKDMISPTGEKITVKAEEVMGAKQYIERARKVDEIKETIRQRREEPFSRKFWNVVHKAKGTTYAPESKFFAELMLQNPKEFVFMRDQFNMRYATGSKASHFSDMLERQIRYEKMDADHRQWFRTLVRTKVDYDILRRLPEAQAAKFYVTEGEALGAKAVVRESMRTRHGEDFNAAWGDMQSKVGAYFTHMEASLARAKKAKIIGIEDYNNMRDYHYSTSITVDRLIREADHFKNGSFNPKLDAKKPVDRFSIKKGQEAIMSDDVMYLAHRHLARMERTIDNGVWLEGMNQMAIELPTNTIAMKAEYNYEAKDVHGKWGRIAKEQYDAAIGKNKAIKQKAEGEKAAARAKVEAVAKEEARVLAEDKKLNPAKYVEVLDAKGKVIPTEAEAIAMSNKKLKIIQMRKGKLSKEYEGLNKDIDKLTKKLDLNEKEVVQKITNKKGPLRDFTEVPGKRINQYEYEVRELEKSINLNKDIKHDLLTELKGERVRISDKPIEREGWIATEYWRESTRKHVMIREDLAPFMDLKGEMGTRIRNGSLGTAARVITGVPFMKIMAVGVEPAFGVGTTPRDVNFFGMTDSNVTNLAGYNKFVIQNYKSVFKDAWTQKGFFEKYAQAGGFHGHSTLAGITRMTLGGRGQYYQPEFLRELPKDAPAYKVRWEKNKMRWANAVNGMTKLSATTETAARMAHTKYLMDVKGFSLEAATMQTNQLLNFMRKGAGMRGLDDLFAFMGATSQALNGHGRAAFQKQDLKIPIGEGKDFGVINKTYVSKLGQYGVARALFLATAFGLGKDHMLGQTPQKRVSNLVIPVPGTTVDDENGQPLNLELKVKLDTSPPEAMIGIMLNQMYDEAYGGMTPERKKLYEEEFLKSWNAQRLIDVPAGMKAMQALFGNIDPMSGDQIFKQADDVAPKDRVQARTNKLAVLGADLIGLIPGLDGKIAPVQVGGVADAYAVSNSTLGHFIGLPTHEWSYMAKNNFGYAVWESVGPIGTKTFFNYAPTDMRNDEDMLFNQTHNSPVYKAVTEKLRRISNKYKAGEISRNDAFESLKDIPQDAAANQLHMKAAIGNLKDRLILHDQWNAVINIDPGVEDRIPKRFRLERASTWEPTVREKWYQQELEKLEGDEKAIQAFNRISYILNIRNQRSIAHGILQSK